MNRDQAFKRYAHVENRGVIILKSDGVDIPKDFHSKLIHSVKLKFMPRVQLKKSSWIAFCMK